MAYEDLLKDTSKPDPDNKDYFLLTVTDLDPGKTYPIQLRWVYKNDKKAEDQEWSAVKNIIVPIEVINAPRFESGDLSADGFNLIVKWSGLDSGGSVYSSNLDRIDIYIKGGQFGATSIYSGKSFKKAGTETFSLNTSDTYYVKLKAVSKRGTESDFSTERSATTVAPLVVDIIAPLAPSSGSVSAGIDNSAGATIGFNAYLNISWSAVSDPTLRGYRIRFRENGSSDPYSYVDSPGTGTTFRLNGLAIGTTYEVSIAAYDELNNTSSSYTSIGTATASGTPFIGKNVTTEGYFGASATGDTGTFKFGYGVETGKRGLVFNSNNYWYIDSSASALFKLGGDTNNYISWDGYTFTVSGNIIANGGSFSGNVAMTTDGASIYNGTLDGTGALNSDGFILNRDGLQFRKNGATAITLQTSTGKLFASNAEISGVVSASTFTSPLYNSGNGVRIYSAGSYDEIEMQASSNQKLKFSANNSGAIIWGPSLNAYIAMPNIGNMQFNVTSPNGPRMTMTTGGSVYLDWPYSTITASSGVDPVNMALRNIGAQTYTPTLTTNGAFDAGFYNGDIWLVRAS